MRHLVLLMIMCLGMLPGYTLNTRLYFNLLDINSGLSQNTVNTIIQDRNGFMWFGTKDGLNRYDGQSFKIFKRSPDRSNGLGNNFITCLCEDSDGHIWAGTDAGVYIYYPKEELFRNFPLQTSQELIIDKTINLIACDKEGYIWIMVETQGVFCYDPKTKETVFFNYYKDHGNIRSFNIDDNGTIWLAFYGGGLYYSKDKLKTIHSYFSSTGQKIYEDQVISKIYIGNYNYLYLGMEGKGLAKINLTTSEVEGIPLSDKPDEQIFVRDLIPYSDDELWVGSETGVYIYNIRTKAYKNIRSSFYDPYSLSDNAIYSLYKDKEGGMWIGSYFGGVNFLPKQYTYFDKFYSSVEENTLSGRRVRELCKGSDGTLWIGTEDAGLYNFNPQTRKFSHFAPSKYFSNIHGLCMDGDDLWVGTFSKGVRVINTRTKQIRMYARSENPKSISDNYVFALCRTTSGQIYLGTANGLLYYDKATDEFANVPGLTGSKLVYDIKEDSGGNIWIATYANGAYKYNVRNKQWYNYIHDEKDTTSLPYNKLISIFEDSHKQIWLTTHGSGFCKYNPATDSFVRYDSTNGIPNDVVYQLVEDNNGFFWITTNKGLVKFNPNDESVRIYTVDNGLLSNQFNYKSSYKSNTNEIYLGSINGLVAFNPETFSENKFIPSVYITDFLLLNKKVVVGDKNSPLKESITFSDSIFLKHFQNSISFRIAALSYLAPGMNQLMYKLEGFDKDWISYAADASWITYSNINYGKYMFRVKGSNSDGVWNSQEKTLFIEIHPPFYLSTLAYCVYASLLMGLLIWLVLYVKKRNEQKQRRHILLFEQEKERELYDTKISFFTNVAHEIRTPLTLIKGPLESLLLKENMDNEAVEELNVMKQNTDRLLDLSNQLLDFRKTEKEGFCLSFAEYNVSNILEDIFHRFSSLAKQENKEFLLNGNDDALYAHIDREAFTKTLSNLFNNALKYSDTYIHVILRTNPATDKAMFQIKVINDGSVVPEEMKEKIFKPFFRYNQDAKLDTPGTGIGLALSRSLAELHHGTLVMDRSTDQNIFVLTLPIYQKAIISLKSTKTNQSDTSVKPEFTPDTDTDSGSYTILVVEDNPEMCHFIKRQLFKTYTILTAEDGMKALDILNKQYVNLIISDIMMPKMDGFKLCKIVKGDINFSHIPVILLTAKTNIQSKIEGMEVGADIYIEKPFSIEYLLAVIANLIKNREKLRDTFARNPLVIANTMASTKTDTEFIEKLQKIIHSNFSNADFKMEDIAETLNMSRSSFYRKIKGVLDLTPNDYLRLERLKAATQLLKDNKYQINEVCYMVGFSSSSYFSKCFYKQFGVLPKDFVNDHLSSLSK